METQEIKAAVDSILEHAGIQYQAHYVCEKKNALGGAAPMDHWSCTLNSSPRDSEESFDFYTGLGLRKLPAWKFGVSGFDGGRKPPRPGTLLHEQWVKQVKVVAPHAADVLHSLILDMSAASQSFEDWCGAFGFDSDSRKAFATYEECQRIANKLRRILNENDIAALEAALQEY